MNVGPPRKAGRALIFFVIPTAMERYSDFHLKTLTPLYTGNVRGLRQRLRGTGLMGSLRWWLEVIVRGLGGRACKVGEDGCRENPCDVCRVFGRTGEAKLFKIQLSKPPSTLNTPSIHFPTQPTGGRGWHVEPGFYGDDLLLRFILRRPAVIDGDRAPLYDWWPALELAARWGGLGAKTQLGFGVVDVERGPEPPPPESFGKVIDGLPEGNGYDRSLPDLRDFFFAKVTFAPPGGNWYERIACEPRGRDVSRDLHLKGMVPVSFAAKYALRYGNDRSSLLAGIGNGEGPCAKAIFGTVSGKPRISRFHISWAYPAGDGNWQFRVWGWIPEAVDECGRGYDRNALLNELKGILENEHDRAGAFWGKVAGGLSDDVYIRVDWCEFKSQGARDPNQYADERAFLKELCT